RDDLRFARHHLRAPAKARAGAGRRIVLPHEGYACDVRSSHRWRPRWGQAVGRMQERNRISGRAADAADPARDCAAAARAVPLAVNTPTATYTAPRAGSPMSSAEADSGPGPQIVTLREAAAVGTVALGVPRQVRHCREWRCQTFAEFGC